MELQIKVAQAVHVLNHDSQSCNRVAANQWLVQFQQTDLAWDVATSILTSDHHRHHHSFLSDFEVEFFAAQILKRKVSIPSLSALSLSLSLSPPPLYLSLCFGWTSIPLFSQNRHCAFFRPGNASISRVLVWRIMVLIFYLLFVFNPRELSLLKCWPRIAWQRTNFCDAAIQRGLIPVNSNQAGFRYSVV